MRGMRALRASCLQLAVLALDEIRLVLRSRRGRVAAAVYGTVNLLPLLLLLWCRNRFVVPWPVDAADISTYLTGVRLFDLALVVVLAHDVLTRGDREGWQDGLAALPVHELVWLSGRLLGRFSALAAIMMAPWVVGWLMVSLWAGAPLDPVPFAAVFLGTSALSLALHLPLVVIAGAVGNSVVGAAVVLTAALSGGQMVFGRVARQLGVDGFSLPSLLVDGGADQVTRVTFLVQAIVDPTSVRDGMLHWYMRFATDAGRCWPPWLDGIEQALLFGLVPVLWMAFACAAPLMLRLRRRAGRWRPELPRLPTFSRWLSELVDQTRPTAPESPAAQRLAAGALVALVAVACGLAVLAIEVGGGQRAVAAELAERTGLGRWPTRFLPEHRAIDLTITGSGELRGSVRLQGRVDGRRDRDLPFMLAPGMVVSAVTDGEGAPLAFRRDPETLWVEPSPDIEVRFSGRPLQRLGDVSHRAYRQARWPVLSPAIEYRSTATRRRWLVDLRRVSWAPEPVDLPGSSRPIECWGETTLELRCPVRLVPVPLPGRWQESSHGGLTTARWSGVSPRLPPVVAGRVRRLDRGSVTLAACSPATDLEGMLDQWQHDWQATAELAEAGSVVLTTVAGPGSVRWRPRWGRSSRPGPRIAGPAGMLELEPEQESRAGMVRAGLVSLADDVLQTRVRFRFAGLASRVAGENQGQVRWSLWKLCQLIELWPPRRDALLLVGVSESAFREVDLGDGQDHSRDHVHRIKLDKVLRAMVQAIGPEAVEAGLRRLADGRGPVDLEAVWLELVGDRWSELQWFRDEVLFGTGVASPRLVDVAVAEQGSRWSARLRLANPGDAATVVPLRLIGSGGTRMLSVPLASGATTAIEEQLDWPVEQVLLDPEGRIVRQKIGRGLGWSRWGGLQ